MNKCSFCGENGPNWGRNFPCHPTETPAFEDDHPGHPEVSATSRGLSAGDIVRSSRGHIAIVTFANSKWGDIRVSSRGKYPSEYVSTAGSWRRVKKASPEQARRWLAEEAERLRKYPSFQRDFKVNPVTGETIFIHDDDIRWSPSKIAGEPRKNNTPLYDSISKILSDETLMKEIFSKKLDFTPVKNFNYIDKNSYFTAMGKFGGIHKFSNTYN